MKPIYLILLALCSGWSQERIVYPVGGIVDNSTAIYDVSPDYGTDYRWHYIYKDSEPIYKIVDLKPNFDDTQLIPIQ